MTKFQKGHKLATGRGNDLLRMNSRDIIMGCIEQDKGLIRLIKKCYAQAMKGSFKHQELLFHYLMGKPIERAKLELYMERGETPKVPQMFTIIADHMRLEALHKDVEESQRNIDPSRIENMEALLNAAQPVITLQKDGAGKPTVDISHEEVKAEKAANKKKVKELIKNMHKVKPKRNGKSK